MKTNIGRFTLILGEQVVPVYSYIEPITDYYIMRVAVKNMLYLFIRKME